MSDDISKVNCARNNVHYHLPWLALAILMLPLLFVGGPDYFSPVSVQMAWNLGHSVLFFAVTMGAFSGIAPSERRQAITLTLLALFVTLVASSLVEWLQAYIDRQTSLGDIGLSLAGTAMSIPFTRSAPVLFGPSALRWVRAVPPLVFFVFFMVPLLDQVYEDSMVWRDFPALMVFDSPREVRRWGKQGYRYAQSYAGRAGVVQLHLRQARYSGFGIRHFPGDWSAYKRLNLSVYSTQSNIVLTCRINDRQHEDDNRYTDRYNGRFNLARGWNELRIPLHDVAAAPLDRRMDMTRISRFGCFLTGLERELDLYLDDVWLDADEG